MTVEDSSPWVCNECNLPEERDRLLRKACHHCGKVLCEACVKYVDDEAFARRLFTARRRVAHCPTCRDRHHAMLRQQ